MFVEHKSEKVSQTIIRPDWNANIPLLQVYTQQMPVLIQLVITKTFKSGHGWGIFKYYVSTLTLSRS